MKVKMVVEGRGYTLLEILAVIVIIGVILAITIPMLLGMYQRYRAQTAVSQIAIHLRFARNACVKQKLDYQVVIRRNSDSAPRNTYSVQFDSNRDGVFEHVPGFGSCIGGSCYVSLPPGVKILDSSIPGPINFNFRGGVDSGSGDVNIEAVDGTEYRLTITAMGGVSWKRL